MIEITSEKSIKDSVSGNNPVIEEPFSLPLIPANPNYRCSTSPHKSASNKQKIVLPHIKENQPPNKKRKLIKLQE